MNFLKTVGFAAVIVIPAYFILFAYLAYAEEGIDEMKKWTVKIPLDQPIPDWYNFRCESKYVSYGWYEWARCQF